MHANPVIERAPDGSADLVFILVHGRTQNPADMDAIADRLALDGVRYLFPAADANSWYPDKFMAPVENNEPGLSAAIAHYEGIVAGLIESGVRAHEIVVGGFSQGACLTCEFLARHPRRYGAAAIMTGGLIGPKGTVWPLRSELTGMPAYLSNSENDPWVPLERTRESCEWMMQSGAVTDFAVFEGRGHEVLDAEIEAVRALVESVR